MKYDVKEQKARPGFTSFQERWPISSCRQPNDSRFLSKNEPTI